MKKNLFFKQSLVYVIVFSINIIFAKTRGSLYPRGNGGGEHAHPLAPPCKSSCPRNGHCVPAVQCPAHVRSLADNPLCHINRDIIGVCCFTGSSHAAESDHASRRVANPIGAEDIIDAHDRSRRKLKQWMDREKALFLEEQTIVSQTSPSYGHHLSLMTTDVRANELGRGGLVNLFTAQQLKAREVLSDDDLALGLTGHADGAYCPPPYTCSEKSSRYRNIGGECNNAAYPSWGAVNTGFERLLPPDYSDGIWAMRTSSSGDHLPSARRVSAALFLDGSYPSGTHNLMFMQLGQFIAHDTSAGVVFNIGNGSAIFCCTGDGTSPLPPELQHWACASVAADPDDPFYSQFGHTCLNFVRTQIAPSNDCSVGYAKQMNGATHFLDLSHIYGNSLSKLNSLKDGPFLKTLNDYGRDLPPLTDGKECLTQSKGAACFESGDNHANQVISLTVLHTIFTREHNRIAKALARLNPGWSEDVIFMEARRILQAEFQNIVYKEWLPMLLGEQLIQAFSLYPAEGYSTSYDPHVNPSLTAEFSTAAMRFGHSVVDGKLSIPSVTTGTEYEAISLPEVMFQPSRLRLRPFLDRTIAGLMYQPMQRVDPFITESLTRYLFHGGNPFGLDLASINIQRGRDYGVRSYNEYRRLLRLSQLADFNGLPPAAAQRLLSVYQNPEDLDLWVGGLLEPPVEGGVVGITFANIIADQFSRLKTGDRYFNEYGPDINPGAFTESQLAEVKKVTLSRILCDNSDGIELTAISPNAFMRADLPGNEPVPCSNPAIPSMDLSRFKEIY